MNLLKNRYTDRKKDIVIRVLKGATYASLARKYGVTNARIRQIFCGTIRTSTLFSKEGRRIYEESCGGYYEDPYKNVYLKNSPDKKYLVENKNTLIPIVLERFEQVGRLELDET